MASVPAGPLKPRTPLPQGLKALLLQRVPFLSLLLLRRDFLRDSGWTASGRSNAPVGGDGAPLPWYTYSFIHFLEGRVRPDMAVFEYGSGHSTLWWARHVEHVAAVEHDQQWMKTLVPRLPDNVDLRFVPSDSTGHYARSASERGRRFDVLVIDGMERNESAFACLPALKDDGVIIWDNSDWTALWADGMRHLEESGFRRIDFRGLGPLVSRPWTTSVFYRPGNNCFEI